eukprot:2284644-Prymnesium_polylepis.1
MHPTDQMSMPSSYVSFSTNSSGARYHRVTTYSVSCWLALSPRSTPAHESKRSGVSDSAAG